MAVQLAGSGVSVDRDGLELSQNWSTFNESLQQRRTQVLRHYYLKTLNQAASPAE